LNENGGGKKAKENVELYLPASGLVFPKGSVTAHYIE
jgi:hypothetical protein